ncbi:hypothetical protein HA466_0288980 [Hirschfeldia incana]|nr:hypothetical protein HA466_0288980 [Hirschfeldia incana]
MCKNNKIHHWSSWSSFLCCVSEISISLGNDSELHGLVRAWLRSIPTTSLSTAEERGGAHRAWSGDVAAKKRRLEVQLQAAEKLGSDGEAQDELHRDEAGYGGARGRRRRRRGRSSRTT